MSRWAHFAVPHRRSGHPPPWLRNGSGLLDGGARGASVRPRPADPDSGIRTAARQLRQRSAHAPDVEVLPEPVLRQLAAGLGVPVEEVES